LIPQRQHLPKNAWHLILILVNKIIKSREKTSESIVEAFISFIKLKELEAASCPKDFSGSLGGGTFRMF
jgi:hypothetical protein